ncbi:MAG: copper resistance protein NlpE [Gemmatimonadota bacterium]|nr:copper resistance protein NlpE [Gemmatimonadota bacterium]
MAAATACSDVTGTNRADGVYYLQAIGNTSLPASYQDSNTGRVFTAQSDQLAVNSDGTYTDQQIYRDGTFQGSYTESGNWRQSGNVVTFNPTFSSAGYYNPYSGTLGTSGAFGGARSLSVNLGGSIWYYSE